MLNTMQLTPPDFKRGEKMDKFIAQPQGLIWQSLYFFYANIILCKITLKNLTNSNQIQISDL